MNDRCKDCRQPDEEDPGMIELTEREMTIAKVAAKIAIRELSDEFYKQIGRGVVTRALVWVGLIFVGFAVARGWIPPVK